MLGGEGTGVKSEPPKNKTMKLTKSNIKEFTQSVQELIAQSKLTARSCDFKVDFSAQSYWIELKRLQSDTNRRARELTKKYKTVQSAVKACELHYLKLSEYHRRVKNPRTGKFVDWWKGRGQKMLTGNGHYTYYTTEKSIVKQILKII